MGNPRPIDPRDRRESLAQVAQNADVMRDVFQKLLQSREGRSYEITACRAGPLRRGESYHYAVQYDLSLHDPVTGDTRDQLVAGVSYGPGRTLRIWESLRAGSPESTRGPAPAPMPAFAYVPELDMLVQAFPNDHRLPALAEVMTGPPPELVSPLLGQFGSAGWQVEDWATESIRYRVDSRATLRIRLRATHAGSGRTETRSFYAKIYRGDAEARRAHDTQRNLQDRLQANAAPFFVATPVTNVARLRTLVQTEVPGKALLHLLRKAPDVVSAVRMAARATAALHRLDLNLDRLDREASLRSLPSRIARLEGASQLLSSVRPDLANELADIVSVVVDGLTNAPVAPTHGDLKPGHFLMDDGRVGLLDFDFLSASDPILDVANMESHLAKAQAKADGRRASAETAASVFVREYFVQAPEDGRARLPLYRTMASIGEAARALRGNDPQWRNQVEACIRQAQKALTDDGHATRG